MTAIVTSLHGREIGLDASGRLVVRNGIQGVGVDAQSKGATGDGTTDDTSAFQKALDTGQDVVVPPGSYKITGSLSYTAAGQRIIGSGISDCSLVFANGTSDGLTCKDRKSVV